MSTTAWVLVIGWVAVLAVVASTIVWTHRRGPENVRLVDADAEFVSAMAKRTGNLSHDLRLWHAHYRWLAAQYRGNPPVELTELLFKTMLDYPDHSKAKGDRTA